MAAFGFEKLDAWQKAVELADVVYTATRSLPSNERFGLTQQIRRAAVSVSSNLAEGSSRGSKKDFARFVEMAYGSLMEAVSQATIARRMQYIDDASLNLIRDLADELARMLSGLRTRLLRESN
jgi:four helix bundle protein